MSYNKHNCTLLGKDTYIKSYVVQNCIMIMRGVEKHDPLSDGFIHFQHAEILYEHRDLYSIHEREHHITTSRGVLILTTSACR